MRLRELHNQLSGLLPGLEIFAVKKNDGNYIIQGVGVTIKAVVDLEKLNLFKDPVTLVKDTPLFEGYTRNLIVNEHQLGIINKQLSILRYSVIGVIKSIESANIDLNGESNLLSIKLPDKVDIDFLDSFFSSLKRAIALPVSEHPEGGQIVIKNFDSGSFWVDILLPSMGSLLFLSKLIHIGISVKKENLRMSLIQEHINSLKIKTDTLEDIKSLNSKRIATLIEEEARLLEKDTYSDHDEERVRRLQLAIRETSEMLLQGVSFIPSMSAPEEVKNSFPDYIGLNLVEQGIINVLSDKDTKEK